MSPAIVGSGAQWNPGVSTGTMKTDAPLVLRRIGVGPGCQPDVVGVLDRAGKDLLAGDHVLVSVTHGACLEGAGSVPADGSV